jgi:hypothetical protein
VGHAGRRRVLSDRKGRAERRMLDSMDRLGLIPMGLLRAASWQALATVPTSIRSPLRLRLVLAWAERERQPLMWAAIWRAAIEAGTHNEGRKVWLVS